MTRAPGPARDSEYVSMVSGDPVPVGRQLRTECSRRHRINCNRDVVLAKLDSARKVGETRIWV